MRILLLAIVACPILLSGCATGVDQRLTRLQYMPSRPAAQTAGPAVGVAIPSEAHGLARNPGGEPIVADIVSSSGRRIAGVVVVESIPQWAGKAIEGELRAAGVNAGLGLEPRPGRAMIKTEIAGLKNQSKTQWSTSNITSTVTLAFTVERDGKVLGTVDSVGTATVEKSMEYKDLVHDAMERALRDAITKAVPRLVELAKS